RAGEYLLRVSRKVANRITAPGLNVETLRAHRALDTDRTNPGMIDVRLFSTAAEEATAVADMLRRAHLEAGRPWRSMAVLVRSGVGGHCVRSAASIGPSSRPPDWCCPRPRRN